MNTTVKRQNHAIPALSLAAATIVVSPSPSPALRPRRPRQI